MQNVRLIDTPGNPVVYGDWLNAPGKPTILFYGHYDVQPVDPVDLWTTPALRGDRARRRDLRARRRRRQGPGVHAHQGGRGAPEAGRQPAAATSSSSSRARKRSAASTSTTSCATHKQELAADVVVISDSPMFDRGIPSICYGLRGLDVLPDRPARHEERPAFGLVRRRGGQPGVRAGAACWRR